MAPLELLVNWDVGYFLGYKHSPPLDGKLPHFGNFSAKLGSSK